MALIDDCKTSKLEAEQAWRQEGTCALEPAWQIFAWNNVVHDDDDDDDEDDDIGVEYCEQVLQLKNADSWELFDWTALFVRVPAQPLL